MPFARHALYTVALYTRNGDQVLVTVVRMTLCARCRKAATSRSDRLWPDFENHISEPGNKLRQGDVGSAHLLVEQHLPTAGEVGAEDAQLREGLHLCHLPATYHRRAAQLDNNWCLRHHGISMKILSHLLDTSEGNPRCNSKQM